MMPMLIRPAAPSDIDAVLALLSASDLTTSGLREDAAIVLVVPGDDAIVACAALEVDGSDALLRSVAVAGTSRGTGLGAAIVARIEEEARRLGVETLYLLTTTAEGFFDRLGYHRIDLTGVPGVVRASAEFSSCASAGATAMRRSL